MLLLAMAVPFSGEEHLRVQEDNSEQWIGSLFRRVSRHVSRHVCHFSSPVLWLGFC